MLSIILPTFNEAKNLPELLKRIVQVMGKATYEVIVVDDDSPDKTWQIGEELAKTHLFLKVIRRVGRRGLSSAVVEGFDAAKGDVLMVMDSDLQHDPQLINQLAAAVTKGADIAVASRYMKGGSVGEWVTGRRLLSKTATWLTRKIPPVDVSDPMSGFFALKKSVYQHARPMLRPSGFKILFEILGHLPSKTKSQDVPLVFSARLHGESKLSIAVELQFIWQLVRIALFRIQKLLFWIACIAIALTLSLRLFPLLPLYTDAAKRSFVQSALRSTADQQGWLLSDVRILRINDETVIVAYRPHRKGIDPDITCFQIGVGISVFMEIPCDE